MLQSSIGPSESTFGDPLEKSPSLSRCVSLSPSLCLSLCVALSLSLSPEPEPELSEPKGDAIDKGLLPSLCASLCASLSFCVRLSLSNPLVCTTSMAENVIA